MTQAQQAERSAVRRATVSDLEKSRVLTLRLSLFDALRRVLDATPAELLDYTAPKRGRAA